MGKRSSAGARKWVDVHFFTDRTACFEAIRKKYKSIYATHLSDNARMLYELDLNQSVALLFGNERSGISKESLKLCDGNFIIPQIGMVESLNISVACAISLYEAFRQRKVSGKIDQPDTTLSEQEQLLQTYVDRCRKKPK
jgi:tRNA (guanosine-2'-O-)-methyltransferase